MAYRDRRTAAAIAGIYGNHHQQLAEQAMTAWRPGDPCTRCGRPMWHRWKINRAGKKVSAIHLAHTPGGTAYEGLQHAACNLSEGASRGNRTGPLRGRARELALAAGEDTGPRIWRHARRW